MDRAKTRDESEWPVSWAMARQAQFRSIAASTPKQRLDWLEQALRFALACGALSRAETPEQRRRRGVS